MRFFEANTFSAVCDSVLKKISPRFLDVAIIHGERLDLSENECHYVSQAGICLKFAELESIKTEGRENPFKNVMARQKLKEIVINRDWCKGCAICVKLCPKQVLELDKKEKATVMRPDDCIICKLCELRCPDLAITVLTSQEGENGKEN